MRLLIPALILMLVGTAFSNARSQPKTTCPLPYNGFATMPGDKLQIAEIAPSSAVTLEECGSPKGCFRASATRGTPVLIYQTQGKWTCGYLSSRDGAGPAWIHSADLHVLSYSVKPPLAAWYGVWEGGEDRVLIRAGKAPGELQLAGNAQWHGADDNVHLGDAKGEAAPQGNQLHFVENGPNSCAIDLTLLGLYIKASDNQMCGGMNARFQGIWKRVGTRPRH